VLRFVKKQFFEYQESTIGAAFLTQTLTLPNAVVKFEIWDTAGQERYHSLAPMYYRGASAAVIAYDITNASTFSRAKVWVRELQRQGSPNVVMILVGNKCDCEDERQVPTEDAAAYAREQGIGFMETSAKTNHNVQETFMWIAKQLQAQQAASRPNEKSGSVTVDPDLIDNASKPSGCCKK